MCETNIWTHHKNKHSGVRGDNIYNLTRFDSNLFGKSKTHATPVSDLAFTNGTTQNMAVSSIRRKCDDADGSRLAMTGLTARDCSERLLWSLLDCNPVIIFRGPSAMIVIRRSLRGAFSRVRSHPFNTREWSYCGQCVDYEAHYLLIIDNCCYRSSS